MYRALGDERRLPWALQRLGIEAYVAGDFTQAAALLDRGARGVPGSGQSAWDGVCIGNPRDGAARLGDQRQAAALHRESLTLHRDLADPVGDRTHLGQVALLAAETREAERAARLLGAAEALFT